MCDRTQEFLQCVEQFGQSLVSAQQSKRSADVPQTKSAFHDAASEIAKGIHRTSGVLSKLTKLVRRQGLFDDPTEEINTLIFRIKQDLDELNTKCDSAQQYVEGKKRSMGEQSQSASHNVKVVGQLKADLMNATKDFKNVLEVRSSKMKGQIQRKVELTGTGTLSPMRHFNATSKSDLKQNSSNKIPDLGNTDINTPYSSSPGTQMAFTGQQQQLLLAPPANNQYYEAREQAVTEVEKTIGELGTLFKRLATMIAEQQELVERIDEDVENAVSNAEGAKAMLLKTYESVSSNRGLYTKLAGILALFALFFVIFLM